MSTYEIRRDRHYDRINGLNAELRGVIEGVGQEVDDGRMTAGKALARIREKAAKTQAAIDASWTELLGGAS